MTKPVKADTLWKRVSRALEKESSRVASLADAPSGSTAGAGLAQQWGGAAAPFSPAQPGRAAAGGSRAAAAAVRPNNGVATFPDAAAPQSGDGAASPLRVLVAGAR